MALENFEKADGLKTREDLTWWRPITTYLGFTHMQMGNKRKAEVYLAESVESNQAAIDAGAGASRLAAQGPAEV